MRSHQPPIEIDDFDHPHALTGIPSRRRPDWADATCATCSGRGCRNELLHLDSMRCRQAVCTACDGAGWTGARRMTQDIVLVGGLPAWTTTPAIRPRVVDFTRVDPSAPDEPKRPAPAVTPELAQAA